MGRINTKKLAEDMEILAAAFRKMDEEKMEIQRQIVLMHMRIKDLETKNRPIEINHEREGKS